MLTNEEQRAVQVEKYLNGLMTSEEKAEFEALLMVDNELADEVKMFQEMESHFSETKWHELDNGADTQELEAYFRSEEARVIKDTLESAGIKYSQKKKKNVFPRLIAASIIGILFYLGGNYFLINRNPKHIYENYNSVADLPSLMSRGGGEGKDLIEAIVVAFQDNKPQEVLNSYKAYLIKADSINENLYIYGGMAYLELNEYSNAINEFNKMISSNSIDSSKGLWFKALAYLKKGDKENLKETLALITKDKENFNYKKALALLEEID